MLVKDYAEIKHSEEELPSAVTPFSFEAVERLLSGLELAEQES